MAVTSPHPGRSRTADRSRLLAGAVAGLAAALAVVAATALFLTPVTNASRQGAPAPAHLASARTAAPVAVHVVGNHLTDGAGQPIRLLGVDRSGTEYTCIGGWGIFDGPNDATSVSAMASWDINAVRVPLNEDCWLGINGVNPAVSGAAYRAAIVAYVDLLHTYGLVAILDLHWSAPGAQLATGQQVMADADHSPAFWSSVATTFKDDPGVVFDLYNEPHDISWACWLGGCTTAAGWQAAGMQSLIDAVRSTGATQPVMAGGLAWSNDLSGWLANEPSDPDHQLVASLHMYSFNACVTAACWNSEVAPVAAVVPVVTGELGENDCAHSFIDTYMAWADAHGISYLGWTWDASPYWTCTGGPTLITDYSGTPSGMGAGLHTHLLALAAASPPPPPPPPPPSPPPPSSPSGDVGYRVVTVAGGVNVFGRASSLSPRTASSATPAVGAASTPDGKGYWVVTDDGGIFSVGDAGFYGSMGNQRLAAPIVGMAATPDGKGYWLVGADGGIFAFGDARYSGSTGAMVLNRPIVGMAATPDGKGYWLVGADGGIFAFGDARYSGSTGAMVLNRPIVGMAATPDGKGYWLVGADGGIFAFGDARYSGSTGAMVLNRPIVGMAATPDGKGYWLVGADGGIFAFGDAGYFGSASGGLPDGDGAVAIVPVP